jgi:hypothetical protein
MSLLAWSGRVLMLTPILISVFLFISSVGTVNAAPALEAFEGDFDEMPERRSIRALVVYNRMMYFLEGGTQSGQEV